MYTRVQTRRAENDKYYKLHAIFFFFTQQDTNLFSEKNISVGDETAKRRPAYWRRGSWSGSDPGSELNFQDTISGGDDRIFLQTP